ncbi:MAG: prolipoprotein diacylglyceryl transferase [Candidatus Goldbacteria bacterium]|nr:prolipoprotein diacylglyceryl transferase [Candidatus Goldiibacteriota bacterium]
MHPIIADFGFFQLRSYGLSTAIGFLAGILLAGMLAKKEGFKGDPVTDIGLVSIIGAVIGARLLYVGIWWDDVYSKNIADIFKVWEGGLVFYGGLIGAIVSDIVWLKLKKLPILRLGDICMPFVSLGHAIGRIGCYFNGCCYGAVDEKCGVVFPAIGDNLPHLPVQLYESVLNFLNFLFLLLFFRRVKKINGVIFFLYFMNYGIIRFVMELFRGDAERGQIMQLSTSTFISIFMIAAGAAGAAFVFYKWKKNQSK